MKRKLLYVLSIVCLNLGYSQEDTDIITDVKVRLTNNEEVNCVHPTTENGERIAPNEDLKSFVANFTVNSSTTDKVIYIKISSKEKFLEESDTPSINEWVNRTVGDSNLDVTGLQKGGSVILDICDGGGGNKILFLKFEYTGTYTNTMNESYTFELKGINETFTANINIIGEGVLNTASTSFDSVSFYPNPANNSLHISSEKVIQEIAILNAIGQQIKTQNLNTKTSKVDISSLQPGVYLLKYFIDRQPYTSKFVKN